MGRYIKYEIKGSYKFILGVLALVLILITGIYVYVDSVNEPSAFGATMVGLSSLVMFGTALTTFLYIVGSFRKELYEDRGYLTFTLPLTGNQILGAKLIVAIIWFLLLGFVVGSYNILMMMKFVPIEYNTIDFSQIFSVFSKELVVILTMGFIGGVNTLILIYFSMALSRVTFRNKKIGGLWFIIFLVLSGIIAYGQVKIATALPYYIDLNTFKVSTMDILGYHLGITVNANQGLMITGDMGHSFLNIAGFIYSIAIGVLSFLGTGYIIENKIDL